jgi:hypothetical protein
MRHSLSLLALLVALAGCDAASPETDDAGFSLRLSGALDADFTEDAAESQASARINTRTDGKQDLLINLAAARHADGEEVAQLSIRYRFDGVVTPGTYQIDDTATPGSEAYLAFAYQLESTDLSSRYSSRGGMLALEVIRVGNGHVSGRLAARNVGVSGYRTLYGQREELTLAGPVNASATFEAALVE